MAKRDQHWTVTNKCIHPDGSITTWERIELILHPDGSITELAREQIASQEEIERSAERIIPRIARKVAELDEQRAMMQPV